MVLAFPCAMTMATLPACRQFPGTNAAALEGAPPLRMVLPKGRHPPASLFVFYFIITFDPDYMTGMGLIW